MRFDGDQFSDETIKIDEDEFRNCRFISCRIVFTGAGPAKIENCVFD